MTVANLGDSRMVAPTSPPPPSHPPSTIPKMLLVVSLALAVVLGLYITSAELKQIVSYAFDNLLLGEKGDLPCRESGSTFG